MPSTPIRPSVPSTPDKVSPTPVMEAPTSEDAAFIPEEVISSNFLVHIVEDGFSAHGQIWYRGQEIEYSTDEQVYKDTMDRYGKSWLDLDDAGQMRKYGRVYFRRGPWPGNEWEDENSREAEQKRGRKPRPLAPVSAARR